MEDLFKKQNKNKNSLSTTVVFHTIKKKSVHAETYNERIYDY